MTPQTGSEGSPPSQPAPDPKPTWMDRAVDRLAHALLDRKNPDGRLQKTVRLVKRGIVLLNIAGLASLLVFLVAVEWVGERHWLTAFFLYVPRQVWLLPLAGLAVLAAWARPRMLYAHLTLAVFIVMHHMGFCWSLRRSSDEADLAVMTNNIGQNNRQEFTSFLKSENPDLVLLQEAGGRSARYMAAYPEYKAAERGEFVLLSKWPVKNAGFVALTNEYQGRTAAWFEVETRTGSLIVYSVHLPTPRSELYRSRGLGLVAALVGTMQDGKSSTSRYRGQLDTAWNNRVDLTRQLHDCLEKETRPFIVVGDFNMTPNGYLYRLFTDSLKDAFAEAGRGFGFTLPGSTRNPLTAFGPWMRIDYLFAGPGFKPVYARVESDRKSQHRAVVAKFKRVEASHSRVDGGTGSRK